MYAARASSFSHAGYQYQQNDYSQEQPRSYSQPTSQYAQYPGSGSQQSPITPDIQYGSQDWAASYAASGPSMDLNAYQMTTLSGGMDLDLPSAPNPEELEGVDVNAFTTSAYQEWRPPGFSENDLPAQPVYAAQSQIRHYGALSDPTPNIPPIIELSSDEASNPDSAYVTARHGNTGTELSVDDCSFAEPVEGASTGHDQAIGHHQAASGRPCAGKFSSDSQVQQAGSGRGRRRISQLPPCSLCPPDCAYVPKNTSDANKHMNRHTKPYRCAFPECKAKSVGFATSNDLDRHHKSGKHKLRPTKGSGKGYICYACTVQPDGQPKWWDRLDNFKAHVDRKHKEMDKQLVVRMSERNARPEHAITEFGDNSTYFTGSVADRDHYYQQQDPSNHQLGGFGHPSNNGEILPWPEKEMDPPSATELSGIGQAQHLADTGVNRRAFDGPAGYGHDVNDDDDGLTTLGPAVEMMEPAAPFLDVPKLTLSRPGGLSPKRPSDDYEDDCATKKSCTDFDMYNMQFGLKLDDCDGEVQCPECGKIKKRPCDLRKHRVRHYRPFGCTIPRCHVRQGSKSDWQRHEMKSHVIQESWKCTLSKADDSPCHANFHTEASLRKHLSMHAALPADKSLDELCEEMHLGREAYGRFWCGFCVAIKPVDHQIGGKSPREIRSEHIGQHFKQDGRRIGEYVCPEMNKKHEEMTREEKSRARDMYNRPPVVC